ncbi:MAG TPA: threonine/serine exporter family protein [Holophaga sp.]|nr:threonine/serine exporter family protein [Holophaga sp.]
MASMKRADPTPSSHPEVAFVLELGRALQTFGVSAATLETALGRVADHLGLEGALYATPTGFLASLRKEGHHSKTYLQRIEAGESNLEKLAEAEGLVDLVLQGEVDVAGARARLAALKARPNRYGATRVIGAFGLSGLGVARCFEGGWREMLLGALLGLLVGLAVTSLQRRHNLNRLAPLLGGLVSAAGSALLAGLLSPASQAILILCGIIVLVPGLGLLVSMQELGTGNLVSGTARLAGTGLVFVLLAFGVGLGQRMVGTLQPPPMDPVPLPAWTLVPALALTALSFLVVFQGRMEDYGWTLAATVLGWGAARIGTQMLGPEAGAGLAALVLGSACNLWARRTRRPGATLLLPSLMLILPGSLGFRSLTLMLHQQPLEGLQAGFQAMVVTIALMLGLLLANATVSRRSF